MKKSKIAIIAIIIFVVIAGLIANVYVNKKDHISKSTAKEMSDTDLAFAVLGDIHGNVENFQEAINDLHTINPYMDALILNGDTVDQGIEKQYNLMKDTINKNKDLLPKTIIKNIGNHEFFDYSVGINSPQDVQNSIDRYLQFSGEEKVYHDTWVNDYHFISLGSEDGSSETLDAIKASISEKQQGWLKEKLAENYQKGKPIFVFMHQPLDFKYGGKDYVGTDQSEQIKEILSQYPEVILFSSHTHSDLDESSVQLNTPFTMINTGAIAYTMIPDESAEGGMRRESYIKGVYIQVKGNNVVVKGRDIKEKQ